MQGSFERREFNLQKFLAKSTKDQIKFLNENPTVSLTEEEINIIISDVNERLPDNQLKAQFLSALMKISPATYNSTDDLCFHFSLTVELLDQTDFGVSRLYIDSNFYVWEDKLAKFLRENNFEVAKESETSRHYILINKKSENHADTLANPNHHRGYSLDETLSQLPALLAEFCKNNKISPDFHLADIQTYAEAFKSFIENILLSQISNYREDYADYLPQDKNTYVMISRLAQSVQNFYIGLQTVNATQDFLVNTQNYDKREQSDTDESNPQTEQNKPSISIQEVFLNPYKPRSRSLLVWLFSAQYYTFFRGIIDGTRLQEAEKSFSIKNDIPQGFSNYVKNLLLLVFGFYGYNPIEKKALATNGQYETIDPTKVGWGILILSILGVPNRPGSIKKSGRPILSANQVLFTNWVGGWTLTRNVKTWSVSQFLEIPFKFALVLPFNILRALFNLAVNITRFLTELLPHAIASILMFIDFQSLKFIQALAKSDQYRVVKFLGGFVLGVFALVIAIVQYAAVWAIRIGKLLTSPAESATNAFAAGRSIKIGWFGPTIEGWIAYGMGLLGWLSSFALSAILWTLILPIIISAVTTFFPAIIPAIAWFTHLPVITASIAWVTQFPVVTTAITNAGGLFTTVGSALGAAFSPAIMPAAGLLGLQISTMAMTAGTTLGMLGIPALIVGNYIADGFSGLWIKLHSNLNRASSSKTSSTTDPLLLGEEEDDVVLLDLQRRAQELAQKRENLFKGANKSAVDAARTGEEADKALEQKADSPRSTKAPQNDEHPSTDDEGFDFDL